jgi:hypothetical protein
LDATDCFLIAKPARPGSLKTAVDDYIDLFRCAISRRANLSPSAAALLSGGRDSRHITLELVRSGHKPSTCYTADAADKASPESAVAAAIALRAQIPHVVVPGVPSVRSEVRAVHRTHFCGDRFGWVVALADAIGHPTRPLYDGIGGDVLSAGLFLTPERMVLSEAARWRDLAATFVVDQPFILKERFRDDASNDAAMNLLIAELTRHQDAPNPIGSFIFWNRTRRCIALAPFSILNLTRDVYAPYLDHALWDYLSSLPASLLVSHDFHTDTISRAYPNYADLPYYVQKPRPLPGCIRRQIAVDMLGLTSRSRNVLVARTRLLPRLLLTLVDHCYDSIDWVYRDAIYAIVLSDCLCRRRGVT